MREDWRSRAYDQYVSSGQSASIQDVKQGFAQRQPYVSAIIRNYILPDRNQVIIDLGCGSGAYLYSLREQGYTCLKGVDVSPEQVEAAHTLGLSDVVCDTIDNYIMALPDSSADVILLIDVLEHLNRQELFTLLDMVFRVLKPGGKCLMHVPNAEGLFGMRIRYGDITHELAFTPKSMSQILTLVGFEEVNCFEDKPIPHNSKSTFRRIIWDVTTLIPRLMLMVETGHTHFILSQNMLVLTVKSSV